MSLRHRFHRSRPRLLFFHIPKTAGSSVSAGLRRHYRLSHYHVKSGPSARAAAAWAGALPGLGGDEAEVVQALRLALVGHALACGYRFVTGHVWFAPSLAGEGEERPRLITVLRDPVERWISLYLYGRHSTASHAPIREELEAFLESPRARQAGETQVRYVGGLREDHDYRSEAAVANALENLRRFDVVGMQSEMGRFSEALAAIGVPVRLPRRRTSPAPPGEREALRRDPSFMRRIEALCEPDLAFYDAVRAAGGAVRR